MNITARLQELDPTLVLHNEGDWQNPLDPQKPGYTSFNDAGIETETGEFLYSMTRILKPRHVLETGTHVGVGMAYIGQALKDNKSGELDTIEFLQPLFSQACERRVELGLDGFVNNHLMDVKDFDPGDKEYKLMLIDTEPQTRFAELLKFFPFLADGGFVFIHDLHQHMHQIPNEEHGFAWPFGLLPSEVKQLVAEHKLVPFHFPTPRGLTGFYKPHPDDYKWSS